VATELRDALYGSGTVPQVNGYIVGLGGRDITLQTIKNIVQTTEERAVTNEFVDLKLDLIREEDR